MKKPKEKPSRKALKADLPAANPLYAQFVNFSTRKGDLARTKILSATLHCIAHLGIEATTFESIGKFSGMRRAHVAYYFPDRDELVFTAIQLAISTAQQSTVSHVFEAASDKDRLRAFIYGTFDWAKKNPEHTHVVALFYYYAGIHAKYRAFHTEIREQGALRIAAILKPMLPNQNVKTVFEKAKLVQNLITGSLVDALSTNTKISLSAAAERTSEQLHLALGISGGK